MLLLEWSDLYIDMENATCGRYCVADTNNSFWIFILHARNCFNGYAYACERELMYLHKMKTFKNIATSIVLFR